MTCDEARRLIHLYREGERTQREERALARHLEGCEACARLASEVLEDLEATALLRTEEVPAPDQDLTDRIMAGVRALEREGGRETALQVSGWRRSLAVAAAAVLLLLLTGQELLTYSRLARLEARVAAGGFPAAAPLNAGVRGLERGLDRLHAAALRPGGFEGEREWIAVDAGELASALRALGAEPALVPLILEGLAARYPGLQGVDAGNGLDGREVETLLRHREEILSALRAL